MPRGLTLECGGHRFPASAFDPPANAESAESPEAAGLRAFLESDDGFVLGIGVGQNRGSWRQLARSAEEVTFGRGDPPRLTAYVTLRLVDGAWRARSFGAGCVVRPYRHGLIACRWGLDPKIAAPTEAATVVYLLVNDTQCASGVGPDDRLLEPEVSITDEAVTILFNARVLTGMHTCPGHPPARRAVDLDETLGSRLLLDGGIYPPQPPCAIDQWGHLKLDG